MPDLTVSLTSAQAQRVAAAFAHLNDGNPATAAQVQAWIKRKIREEVRAAEHNAARNAAVNTVDSDLNAEGWNA